VLSRVAALGRVENTLRGLAARLLSSSVVIRDNKTDLEPKWYNRDAKPQSIVYHVTSY